MSNERAAETVRKVNDAAANGAQAAYDALLQEYNNSRPSDGTQATEYDNELAAGMKGNMLVFASIWAKTGDAVQRAEAAAGGNNDGKLDETEIANAMKSDKLSAFDKLMLKQLADQYTTFRDANQKDGEGEKNDAAITTSDVDTYLKNNEASVKKTEQSEQAYKAPKQGDTEATLPDGKKIIWNKETSAWELHEVDKANNTTKKVENATVKVENNGKVLIQYGTEKHQTIMPNGTVVFRQGNESGEIKEVWPNGDQSKRVAKTDKGIFIGGKDRLLPKGCTQVEIKEDGTLVVATPGFTTTIAVDGTMKIANTDGAMVAYTPQGDENRSMDIREKDKGYITVNGEQKPVNKDDQVTMSENGDITVRTKEGKETTYSANAEQNEKQKEKSEDLAAKSKEKAIAESKVHPTQGYYQTAERILNEVYGLNARPKEIMKLARLLKELNGNKNVLTTRDQLVSEQNWQQIAAKINEIAAAANKRPTKQQA